MSEAKCAYCEDPVPAERSDGYCDDRCKDLHERMRKPDPNQPTGRSKITRWNAARGTARRKRP